MPLRYFYSRPRVGGDYILQRCEMANAISTHAPAWGATRSLMVVKRWLTLFLLTPPRGGRQPTDRQKSVEQGIISTHAPAWGATSVFTDPGDVVIISTHAPAWGATNSSILLVPATAYFYSRPRVGGDTGERGVGL